jgi:hypothetical protein
MSVEPETATAAVIRSLRIDPRVPLMADVTGVDRAVIISVPVDGITKLPDVRPLKVKQGRLVKVVMELFKHYGRVLQHQLPVGISDQRY